MRALEMGWKYAFKLQRKKIWEMYFSVNTLVCVHTQSYTEGGRDSPTSTFFILNDHGQFQ